MNWGEGEGGCHVIYVCVEFDWSMILPAAEIVMSGGIVWSGCRTHDSPRRSNKRSSRGITEGGYVRRTSTSKLSLRFLARGRCDSSVLFWVSSIIRVSFQRVLK